MPTSDNYRQFFGPQPHYALIVKFAEGVGGWLMPPIIQSYRLRENADLREKSEKLTRNFMEILKEKIPQGATIFIAPEGHRSYTGKLLPAERGLGAVVRWIKGHQGLVLPLAIRYPEKRNRGLNYNQKIKPEVRIVCGPLLSAEEVIIKVEQVLCQKANSAMISHFLMWQLAQSLPEEMQGVYHPFLFKRTLSGGFELRVNPLTGKVGVWDKRDNCFLEDIY